MDDVYCARCERLWVRPARDSPHPGATPVAVRVVHTGYGCDTGCCGMLVEVETTKGYYSATDFDFGHDFTALKAEAEHIADHLGVTFDLDRSCRPDVD